MVSEGAIGQTSCTTCVQLPVGVGVGSGPVRHSQFGAPLDDQLEKSQSADS